MAVDEMKKNVEKLDELDDALKKAQEELIVCSIYFYSLSCILHLILKFIPLSSYCYLMPAYFCLAAVVFSVALCHYKAICYINLQ